jgi:hypothetical protein
MNRSRFMVLLLAAIAVITGAFYLSGRRAQPQDRIGTPLIPALSAALTQVTAVTIRHGGQAPIVSLRRRGSAPDTGSATTWVVTERDDYPANIPSLRKLLLSIADAKIVEEKTSIPANYATVGVDDPSVADALGTGVDIVTPTASWRLIVGKAQGNGTVVRMATEAGSYLVEPAILVSTETRSWIDPTLVDIPVANIASIAIRPATGPPYVLRRNPAANDDFSLDGVPSGRLPVAAKSLAPSPLAFSAMTAEDVAPAASIDFSTAATAIVTRTDGEVITVTGAASGEQHWLRLTATRNAAFAAKTRGRAYAVPRYRYDAIFRPLEQLLQPKAADSKAHS